MTSRNKVVAGDTFNGYLERISTGRYKGYCKLSNGKMDSKVFNAVDGSAEEMWLDWCKQVRKDERTKAIEKEKAAIQKKRDEVNPFMTPEQTVAEPEVVITAQEPPEVVARPIPNTIYVMAADNTIVNWFEDKQEAERIVAAMKATADAIGGKASVLKVVGVKKWGTE